MERNRESRKLTMSESSWNNKWDEFFHRSQRKCTSEECCLVALDDITVSATTNQVNSPMGSYVHKSSANITQPGGRWTAMQYTCPPNYAWHSSIQQRASHLSEKLATSQCNPGDIFLPASLHQLAGILDLQDNVSWFIR